MSKYTFTQQKQDGSTNQQVGQELQVEVKKERKLKYQFASKATNVSIQQSEQIEKLISQLQYNPDERYAYTSSIEYYNTQNNRKDLMKKLQSEQKDLIQTYIDQSKSISFKLTDSKKGDMPEILSEKTTAVGSGGTKLSIDEKIYLTQITQLFNTQTDSKQLYEQIIKLLKECVQKTDSKEKEQGILFQTVFTMIMSQIYQRTISEKKFLDEYIVLLEQLPIGLETETVTKENNEQISIIQHLQKCSQHKKFSFKDNEGYSYNWKQIIDYATNKNTQQQQQQQPYKQLAKNVVTQYIVQENIETNLLNYYLSSQTSNQIRKHKEEDLRRLMLTNSIKILASLSVKQQLYEQYRFKLLILKLLLSQKQSLAQDILNIVDTIGKQQKNDEKNQEEDKQDNKLKEDLEKLSQKECPDLEVIVLICIGIQKQQQEYQAQIIKQKEQNDKQKEQQYNKQQINIKDIYEDVKIDTVIDKAKKYRKALQQQSQQQGQQNKNEQYQLQGEFRDHLIAYLIKIIYEKQQLDELTKYQLECIIQGKQFDEKATKQTQQQPKEEEQKKQLITIEATKDNMIDKSKKIISDDTTFAESYKVMQLSTKQQEKPSQQRNNKYHQGNRNMQDNKAPSTAVQFIREFIKELYSVRDKNKISQILSQLKDDIKELQQQVQQEQQNEQKNNILLNEIIRQLNYQINQNYGKQDFNHVFQEQSVQFILHYVQTKQYNIYDIIQDKIKYDQRNNRNYNNKQQSDIIKVIIQKYIRNIYLQLINEIYEQCDEENILQKDILDEQKDLDQTLNNQQYFELLLDDDSNLPQYKMFYQTDELLRPYIQTHIDVQVQQYLYKQLKSERINTQNYETVLLGKTSGYKSSHINNQIQDYLQELKCKSIYMVFMQLFDIKPGDLPMFDKQYKNLNVCVQDVLNNKLKDQKKQNEKQQPNQQMDETFGTLFNQNQPEQTERTSEQILKQKLQDLTQKSDIKLSSFMVLYECIKFNENTVYTSLQRFIQAQLVDEKQLKQDLIYIFKDQSRQGKETLIKSAQGKQLAEYAQYQQ